MIQKRRVKKIYIARHSTYFCFFALPLPYFAPQEKGIPIFIESHLIPKNNTKNEDEHYHHDFIYIFRAENSDINLQLEEVSDFEWVKIDKVLKENQESFIGKSLKRMLNLGLI